MKKLKKRKVTKIKKRMTKKEKMNPTMRRSNDEKIQR